MVQTGQSLREPSLPTATTSVCFRICNQMQETYGDHRRKIACRGCSLGSWSARCEGPRPMQSRSVHVPNESRPWNPTFPALFTGHHSRVRVAWKVGGPGEERPWKMGCFDVSGQYTPCTFGGPLGVEGAGRWASEARHFLNWRKLVMRRFGEKESGASVTSQMDQCCRVLPGADGAHSNVSTSELSGKSSCFTVSKRC